MDKCTVNRRQLAREFLKFRKVFTALGDETRQSIFVTLLQSETVGMRVPEITKCTHLSRPAVSHHIQVLKDSGLIGVYSVGTRNYYYVDSNRNCWNGLRKLIDHVDEVSSCADKEGYPLHKGDDIQ